MVYALNDDRLVESLTARLRSRNAEVAPLDTISDAIATRMAGGRQMVESGRREVEPDPMQVEIAERLFSTSALTPAGLASFFGVEDSDIADALNIPRPASSEAAGQEGGALGAARERLAQAAAAYFGPSADG